MNPEIVNIYISKLIKEIEEQIKTKLLYQAQVEYLQTVNEQLNKRIGELESSTKKINKKEVDTSSI